MKLSGLRPCENCGGQLRLPGQAGFYVVMAPRPDEAVLVAGEKDPHLWTELLICGDCYMRKPLDLAILTERRNAAGGAEV
jgi:hypothetical protein